MTVVSIATPIPNFLDRDGEPLENGSIYIGTKNLNPLIEANRISVYADVGLTIPVSQPLQTIGGHLVLNGLATRMYIGTITYSIVVLDEDDTLVYSILDATELLVSSTDIRYEITPAESIALVTPVNYYYPEGYLYRYGTNTVPGTTDMLSAWNAATSLAGVAVTLPAARIKLSANPIAPLCASIVGVNPLSTVIECGAGVTKFLSLGTASVTHLELLRNFGVTGNSTAGAVGIIFGDNQLYNVLSAENLIISGFNGTNGIGIYVKDVVGIQFYNVRVDLCSYNWWFQTGAISGTPTTIDLYSCCSRSALVRGTVIITGYSIRFTNALFENNAQEGLYIAPTAGTNALEIVLTDAWFEGNYGSSTAQYQMVVDGTAAGSTIRPKINGAFFNGNVGTAKALRMFGANIRGLISDVLTPNVAATIKIDTAAQVHFPSWSNNVNFATVVDSSTVESTAYLPGAIKFPATFSSNTDANTLDDYEEGVFTPTIVLGAGSVTYTTQIGTYTKVGRLVTVQINIVVLVATAPGGSLNIGALPITSTANAKGAINVMASGLAAAATTCIVGAVDPSATTLRIYKYSAGALANPGGDVANGCSFQITASYESAT